MNKKSLIYLLILMGPFQPLWAQQDLIKTYADSTKTRTYCLYPSTLRMLDPTGSPEFYQMVNDIEKLVIYTLDSTATADKSYLSMLQGYQALGYDEIASMFGGKNQFFLYGRDKDQGGNYVGVFRQDDQMEAFYLSGNVEWSKIPSLIQNLQNGGNMINIFQLKSPKRGHNPHDKQPD
ncbi:MAG: hypothetical protein WC341_05070 [Bacteroidales bacterium]|jgi:hypothetical protein